MCSLTLLEISLQSYKSICFSFSRKLLVVCHTYYSLNHSLLLLISKKQITFWFSEGIRRWNSQLVEQIMWSVQYQWARSAKAYSWDSRWSGRRKDVSLCFSWYAYFWSHRLWSKQCSSESNICTHSPNFGPEEDKRIWEGLKFCSLFFHICARLKCSHDSEYWIT